MIGERNRLFNFGFLKKVGTGGGKSASRGVKMPRSMKKRLNSWNHDFVCLASTRQSKPPTSFEAGELMRGGLGKKQLTLFPPQYQLFFQKTKLKSRLRSPITLALSLHPDAWLAFGGAEFLSGAGGGELEVESRKLPTARRSSSRVFSSRSAAIVATSCADM